MPTVVFTVFYCVQDHMFVKMEIIRQWQRGDDHNCGTTGWSTMKIVDIQGDQTKIILTIDKYDLAITMYEFLTNILRYS